MESSWFEQGVVTDLTLPSWILCFSVTCTSQVCHRAIEDTTVTCFYQFWASRIRDRHRFYQCPSRRITWQAKKASLGWKLIFCKHLKKMTTERFRFTTLAAIQCELETNPVSCNSKEALSAHISLQRQSDDFRSSNVYVNDSFMFLKNLSL